MRKTRRGPWEQACARERAVRGVPTDPHRPARQKLQAFHQLLPSVAHSGFYNTFQITLQILALEIYFPCDNNPF